MDSNMDHILLTSEPLDVSAACDLVRDAACGAVALFAGTTRDSFEGRAVVSLEYEAYAEMAHKTMRQLVGELRAKWPQVRRTAIQHRLGLVGVAEYSVLIAASSPHRADALQAVDWCISELKARVPIWKKELYQDGQADWKQNCECKPVPASLMQVQASPAEVKRRIAAFARRKRNEVDRANVRDFCRVNSADSCSRVQAVVFKKKDSKSHVAVSKALHLYGQQHESAKKGHTLKATPALDNRIALIESHLDVVKPVPGNVYQRIKAIEDKILYLESISPEYVSFYNRTKIEQDTSRREKQRYSINNIDQLIKDLDRK